MFELTEFLVDTPEVLVELSLHFGIIVEVLCFLYASVNDGNHTQRVGGAGRRVSAFEEVGHELLNALCACRFSERNIA